MPSTHTPLRITSLLIALTVLTGFTTQAQGQVNRRAMKIAFYKQRSTENYEAKNYEEAVRYAQLALDLSPHDASNYYNMACSAALAGKTDIAFEALARSIDLGWDDPEWLEEDSDLTSLRDDLRWPQTIAQAVAAREESAVVVARDGLPKSEPLPLVVALHGFGGNAREFAAYWRDVVADRDVIVVAPRGPAPVGNRRQMRYGWNVPGNARNLDDIAIAEAVADAIAAADADYAVDHDKIIIAGYSQGAMCALNVLANEPDRFAGAITMAASYDEANNDKWEAAKDPKPRVVLIVGERDDAHADNVKAQEALKKANCPVRLEEVPLTGHSIPEDYIKRLNAAIDFVLACIFHDSSFAGVRA